VAARSARDGWPPKGAPKEEREYRIGGTIGRSWAAAGRNAKKKEWEYRFIEGHKKGSSDTMLNILYRAEEGEREKRESGSQQWTTLYYIVI
jgi:hypothetical protein